MLAKRAKILTDSQVSLLLSFVSTQRHPRRNRVIALLSIRAGLRAGEIAKLTWPMVLDPSGAVGLVIELRASGSMRQGPRGRWSSLSAAGP
jgi:integrase/recombinase XerD